MVKLNAAARQGKYTEELWKSATGKTVQEFGDEWKKALEDKVAGTAAAAEAKPKTLADEPKQ